MKFEKLCPDCSTPMHMRYIKDKTFLVCPKKGCKGKHQCTIYGEPIGLPVDKRGRWYRYKIHAMLNTIWDTDKPEEYNAMYSYLSSINMKGHLGQMDTEELTEVFREVNLLMKDKKQLDLLKVKVELEQFIYSKMRELNNYIKFNKL